MYVLYVHDAVNSLCARVVARAGGSHARCDDEGRDDDGTVSAGNKEKVGAIGQSWARAHVSREHLLRRSQLSRE